MAGITGWFGGDSAALDGKTLIRPMAAELWRGEGAEDASTDAAPGAVLAVVPGRVFSDLATIGSAVAVIYGRPHWTSPSLDAIADRDGWAASVIAAYAREGADFLHHLKGWFAVAVYDSARRRGLIAIDRSGIATLAYGRAADGALVFGSTTDAVRAYPKMAATISPQAIYNFLYTFTVPSPTTVYNEQRKVLPGEAIVFEDGEIRPGFYWQMPYTAARTGNYADYGPQLLDILDKGVRRTLNGVGEEEVGAFLSGGLDSSTIAGLLARHTREAKTFTIAFNEPKYDESRYAKIVAEHFKTNYRQYIPTPDDVVDLMPRLADIYDEPYGNTSAVPAYYCAKMARDTGVSVMLAGDGGDEIFAGNERYALMQRIERYGQVPQPIRSAVLEPLLNLPGVDRLPVLGRAQRLAKRYAIPMPDRLFSYGFLASDSVNEMFSPEVSATLDPDEPMAILREAYNRPAGADGLQRMMHLDLKATLADNDLRKVNRMCALAGVEVRYPFLDDAVVAFAATIPSEVLMPGGVLRKFYKDAMKGFLPAEILTKTKHGFGLPFEVWVKTHRGLQDMVRDYVSAIAVRGYFRRDFLDRVLAAAGRPEPDPLDSFAWDIAMLELWLRKHIDRWV